MASRQLRRLTSISKSPIFSHMGETVTGAQSIRAYGMQSKFVSMLENKIDFNQRSSYAGVIADRLELILSLIIRWVKTQTPVP